MGKYWVNVLQNDKNINIEINTHSRNIHTKKYMNYLQTLVK